MSAVQNQPISPKVLELLNLPESELTASQERSVQLSGDELKAKVLRALDSGITQNLLNVLKETVLTPEQIRLALADDESRAKISEAFINSFKNERRMMLGQAIFQHLAPDHSDVLKVVENSLTNLVVNKERDGVLCFSRWAHYQYSGQISIGKTQKPATPANLIEYFGITKEELSEQNLQLAVKDFLKHCLERISNGFDVEDEQLGGWHRSRDESDGKYALELLSNNLGLIADNQQSVMEELRPFAERAALAILVSGTGYSPDATRAKAIQVAKDFGVELSALTGSDRDRAVMGFIAVHLGLISNRFSSPEKPVSGQIAAVLEEAKALSATKRDLLRGGMLGYLQLLENAEPLIAAEVRENRKLVDKNELDPEARSKAAINGMRKEMFHCYGGPGDEHRYGHPPLEISGELLLAKNLNQEASIIHDQEYSGVVGDYLARILNRITARSANHRRTEWERVEQAVEALNPPQAVKELPQVNEAAHRALHRLVLNYDRDEQREVIFSLVQSGMISGDKIDKVIVNLLSVAADREHSFSSSPWMRDYGLNSSDLELPKEILNLSKRNQPPSQVVCDAALKMCKVFWLRGDKNFRSESVTTQLGVPSDIINDAAMKLVEELILSSNQAPTNLPTALTIIQERGKALNENHLVGTIRSAFEKEEELKISLPREQILRALQGEILQRSKT